VGRNGGPAARGAGSQAQGRPPGSRRAHAVGPGRAPVSATPEAAMRLFSCSTTNLTVLFVLKAVALVCARPVRWAPVAPRRTRP